MNERDFFQNMHGPTRTEETTHELLSQLRRDAERYRWLRSNIMAAAHQADRFSYTDEELDRYVDYRRVSET